LAVNRIPCLGQRSFSADPNPGGYQKITAAVAGLKSEISEYNELNSKKHVERIEYLNFEFVCDLLMGVWNFFGLRKFKHHHPRIDRGGRTHDHARRPADF
jgi:hypothetical protein